MSSILVIDAHAGSRSGTVARLKDLSDNILTASEIEEGFKEAREKRPELVILTCLPDDEDALKKCQSLKSSEDNKALCIALLTDRNLNGAEEQAWTKAEVDEVLVRPIGDHDFRRRLRNLISLSRAQDAERMANAKFQSLFNNSSVGMILTDTEGTIADANDTFLNMLGFGREDMAAGRLNWVDLTPSEYAQADQQALEEIFATGACSPFEKEYIRKDGTRIPVVLAAAVLAGETARGITVIIDRSEFLQLEEARKESEERFEGLVSASPSLIFLADATGQCLYVNGRWQEMTGMNVNEALGEGWVKGLHPEDREFVFEHWARMVEKGTRWDYEFRFQTLDGQVTWVSGTAAPVKNAVGKVTGYVGVNVDITQRKYAEQALQGSDERFKLAMKASEDGLYDWNLVTNDIYYSPGWKRMLGYEDSELPNDFSVWEKLTEPEDVARSWEMQQELISKKRDRFELEFKMRHKEGHWVHILSRANALFNEAGEAIRIVGTHVDITSRKIMEEELRESEESFRSLFESVPISLWDEDFSEVLSYLEGIGFREIEDFPQYLLEHPEVEAACAQRVKISAVNKETLRLHKAGSAEELISGLQVTFTEQSYEKFREQLVAIWRGDDHWTAEGEVKTLDGEPRSVVINWSVPPEHRENMSRVLVCLLDVTEKTNLEGQLRQSQKMESVGRLAGGVAHDFNNILTVILNYSNMALDNLKPQDPIRADIEQVVHAGERAADLTGQLLAFSRKQVVEPRVMDLNVAMRNSEKMLQRLIGEDILLEFDLAENLDRVDMDPGQVNQVLVNLAVNARDAMPGGGKMKFLTRNVDLDKDFVIENSHPEAGPHVLIAVSDTGHGMDSETLDQVFEPFFTTKDVDQGTGLGLATVYGIVKQGAGSIQVESKLEEGSTFNIYLPISKRLPDKEIGASPVVSGQQTATILLIEDEEPVREVTQRILTASGYEVLVAAGPCEALDIARKQGDSIDMVLTDVVMPEMSGRECYQQLCEIIPGVQALFMSGYTPDTIAHHGVLEGMAHFIQKPFSVKDLRKKVRVVLDG